MNAWNRLAASRTSNFRLAWDFAKIITLNLVSLTKESRFPKEQSFSSLIWPDLASLTQEKHVQIVGNSKIYFTILIYFYQHIVALRCVAARACAKQLS